MRPRIVTNAARSVTRDDADDAGAQGGVRIQKALARAGVASRREIERWIAEGRIQVNGEVVTRPGTRVLLGRDHVRVDGRLIRAGAPLVYYLLNKPDACVTTLKDPEGRRTVGELMRGTRGRVFPVGRLDYHTTGLLLMTNDGDLTERLLRPGVCPKTYQARVKGIPSAETLRKISRGLVLDGRRTLPCRVKISPLSRRTETHTWVEVVLEEGRRNQIRRIFERVGHPVARLQRIAIGPLRDPGLRPGQHRSLTESEIRMLRGAVA